MEFSGVVNYLADAICPGYKDQLRDLIKVDSSPVVSNLSLLINWLFTRDALGLWARGRWEGERKGDPSPFLLLVIPFVKEPVLVFHAKY